MGSLKTYVEQGEFYKAVVEDGSDIIFIVDYIGKILYHNQAVEETLGHPKDSLVGHNFFDFIQSETVQDLKEKFAECLSNRYTDSIEFRFLCSDGTYRYLEFNALNLKHKEDIEGMILDCRDITQRKKDAEELLRAKKAKEQFLANMSHEIRTPINGIAGMVNLLSETSTTEDQKKYLLAIKNSTDNLKVIINDILDLSVIESGKLRFERIGFNLEYQLGAVVETFLPTANEKEITIRHSIDERIESVLLGDPVRLNQILINLISNAIKFTHEGEINIDVDAYKSSEDQQWLSFDVSDSGVGIPKKKLGSIFDSFSQADESVTRKFGGTGLGLSICKQLVELQGGTISVASTEDVGTTFTFKIAYGLGKREDLVEISDDTARRKRRKKHDKFKDFHILLVEDNDINRMYAANILKKWNCIVDTAENGYTALEKLRKSDYDVVLMDIQMPVMDGFEATKVIRNKLPVAKSKVPIIALTANAIKGDNEKCLAVGMDDYLSKPFLPDELYEILCKYFRKKSDKTADESENIPLEDKGIGETGKVTDLTYLKSICDGEREFMREMIETFVDTTPATLDSMRKWVEEKQWSDIGKSAHRIKPSITFMGINSFKESIKELERYGKDEINTNEIPGLVSELTETCQQAFKELKEVLENELG